MFSHVRKTSMSAAMVSEENKLQYSGERGRSGGSEKCRHVKMSGQRCK